MIISASAMLSRSVMSGDSHIVPNIRVTAEVPDDIETIMGIDSKMLNEWLESNLKAILYTMIGADIRVDKIDRYLMKLNTTWRSRIDNAIDIIRGEIDGEE